MAHFKPPHHDLHCLQIKLFSSLVHKELRELAHHSVIDSTFKTDSTSIFIIFSTLPTNAVLTNRIYNRSLIQTEKSQLEDKRIMRKRGLPLTHWLGFLGLPRRPMFDYFSYL